MFFGRGREKSKEGGWVGLVVRWGALREGNDLAAKGRKKTQKRKRVEGMLGIGGFGWL
jgi:hypothetical protein